MKHRWSCVLRVIAVAVLGVRARSQATISERPLWTWSKTEERIAQSHTMTIDNGRVQFLIKRCIQLWFKLNRNHHTVGWAGPNQANWYHSGLFELRINGRSVNVDRSDLRIVESGERGAVDFLLENKFGRFRTRMLILPKSDALYIEWTLEPKVEVRSIELRLMNFPGSFASLDRKRKRDVVSPDGVATRRNEPYPCDPKKCWWFFFRDAIFDYAVPELRESCYGTSGLVLPSSGPEEIRLYLGNYRVMPELIYEASVRRFRVALIDYFKMGNKESLKQFETERARVRSILDSVGFLPLRLVRAPERLEESSRFGLSEKARAELARLRTLLAEMPERGRWAKEPVTAENDTLDLLDRVEKAVWLAEKKGRSTIAVLEFRCLHAELWGVKEAISKVNRYQTAYRVSHYAEYYWKGEEISCCPLSWGEWSKLDIVVLSNVPFSVFGARRAKALAGWVRLGGGLLILGGTHSFGQSGMDDPALGPLLPVTSKGAFDMRPLKKPEVIQLVAGDSIAGLAELRWSAKPSVLWRHLVSARPGASTIALFGERAPFLVICGRDQGRVAAVCAPPYGEPAISTTPFWSWHDWSNFLARLLLFLSQKPEHKN